MERQRKGVWNLNGHDIWNAVQPGGGVHYFPLEQLSSVAILSVAANDAPFHKSRDPGFKSQICWQMFRLDLKHHRTLSPLWLAQLELVVHSFAHSSSLHPSKMWDAVSILHALVMLQHAKDCCHSHHEFCPGCLLRGEAMQKKLWKSRLFNSRQTFSSYYASKQNKYLLYEWLSA